MGIDRVAIIVCLGGVLPLCVVAAGLILLGCPLNSTTTISK